MDSERWERLGLDLIYLVLYICVLPGRGQHAVFLLRESLQGLKH